MLNRLKVPPAVNQFKTTLGASDAKSLFSLLEKYRPETVAQKNKRLLEVAKKPAEEQKPEKVEKAKRFLHHGLNNVTTLIEKKKAKLVIIAHDVDPLELVLWLPTLCRKKDVPYVIVKGKSRLGRAVHRKTTSVLALTDVESKDSASLATFVQKAKDTFNSRYPTAMKTYGGQVMGVKHRTAKVQAEKRERAATKA